MRGRLLTLLSALSLLLFAAVVVLWVVVGEDKNRLLLAKIDNPEARGGILVFYLKIIGSIVPWWVAMVLTAILPLGCSLSRLPQEGQRPSVRCRVRCRKRTCPTRGR